MTDSKASPKRPRKAASPAPASRTDGSVAQESVAADEEKGRLDTLAAERVENPSGCL